MHSALVRLQNVFGFMTTVSLTLAAIVAISVVLSPQTPHAKLALRNVQVVKGRPSYYSSKREEYAHMTFDLDADLSSLFNWNTKQVFVYLTATFPTTSKIPRKVAGTPHSEAVIWDAIIPSHVLPWHHNTYEHPARNTDKTTKSKRKDKSKSKYLKAAYPEGTKPGILKLAGQKPKYQITTPASKIAGLDNCTLHLRYNIQPWVGALVWSPRFDSEDARSPWYLPLWHNTIGATSQQFDMPLLKDAAEASKSKEELQTATGGEANRGSPA